MPAGRSGAELFELPLVALNTSLLLLSSITYGFAVLEMQRQADRRPRSRGCASPALLGAGLRRHRAVRVRAT